jgi:hypothetical protein
MCLALSITRSCGRAVYSACKKSWGHQALRAHPKNDVPSCHLAQELQQLEDCDGRDYWALSVAGIRLVHQRWFGNGGRLGEGERGAHVGVIPRILQEYGGGDGWLRMTSSIEVRERGTN